MGIKHALLKEFDNKFSIFREYVNFYSAPKSHKCIYTETPEGRKYTGQKTFVTMECQRRSQVRLYDLLALHL
jgi:hypothetical protein